jgi:hypothetical protein
MVKNLETPSPWSIEISARYLSTGLPTFLIFSDDGIRNTQKRPWQENAERHALHDRIVQAGEASRVVGVAVVEVAQQEPHQRQVLVLGVVQPIDLIAFSTVRRDSDATSLNHPLHGERSLLELLVPLQDCNASQQELIN